MILPVWFWLRALWFVLFWFVLQLLQGFFALDDPLVGGGIAWWIHIGGFVAGLALGKVLAKQILPMPPDPPPSKGIGKTQRPWGGRSRTRPWDRTER